MSKQNYWLSFACEKFATKRTQATNGKTRGKSKQHNSSIYIVMQHPMAMKHSSRSGIKEMILWPTSTHRGINQLLSTDTLLKWVTGSLAFYHELKRKSTRNCTIYYVIKNNLFWKKETKLNQMKIDQNI